MAPKPLPLGWLLYLAAFDTMVAAMARGDHEAVDGARTIMTHLHEELTSGIERVPGRHQIELEHQVEMRALLTFLEGRTE